MAPNSDKPHLEFSFRSRARDWDFLKNNPQQILNCVIIGGGAVGAGFLRELALHEVEHAFLFEKNDFASGTSSVSSKLIHAGIRYLENVWNALKKGNIVAAWGHFKFVSEASRERKILGNLAPGLIKPKPIYLVLNKADGRSALSVLSGVWLYWLIQLFQGQFFSPPQFSLTESSIQKAAPEIKAGTVKALFSFWDSETDDARLVIQTLQDANSRGAHALNYVELVSYEVQSDLVRLQLLNKENGESISVQTKLLINATGPWIDKTKSLEKNATASSRWIDKVEGAHLDFYPALTQKSYYVTARDGRFVFILTRDEDGLIYSRVGTTERVLAETDSLDDLKPSPMELDYLKTLLVDVLDIPGFSKFTVYRTDAGVRPLRSQLNVSTFNKSREHDIIEEGRVIHVVGVKLTDFRRVSSELFNRIKWSSLGITIRSNHPSETTPLKSKTQTKLYPEDSVAQVVNETMALHWDDYLCRRRGLQPLIDRQSSPSLTEKQFTDFCESLNLNENARQNEKKRLG